MTLIPADQIVASIHIVRGLRVMLDSDLARLYGVQVRGLNQAVRRNAERFPDDFVFQLTDAEADSLRSQIVILKKGRGQHLKYNPYVFTEQGVAMLSSVLRSPSAAGVNVEIMRAFVRLRRILDSNADLAGKLEDLEKRYDAQFRAVFQAIRDLMTPPEPSPKRIGFKAEGRATPRAAGRSP